MHLQYCRERVWRDGEGIRLTGGRRMLGVAWVHAFVEFKPVFIPLLKNHEHFQIPIIPEMVDEERLCGCTGLYILCLFLGPVTSKNDI